MKRPIIICLIATTLPLLWLWIVVIHHLQVEWTINAQYFYGWAVPFLAAYLLWRRRNDLLAALSEATPPQAKKSAVILMALLALAYAPTRLVEQANPDWRLMSWALALETVGVTLLMSYLFGGARLLARVAFPVMYFLVAVPWPIPLVEHPVIQGLTRADAVVCAELLGWLGIPVIPHGNVFELSNGVVGIDEACSGIRSVQATLMIALFLGEFYRLRWPKRLGLVLAGFALSFIFNAARMSLLVWVAARKGVSAIATWHDPAGVTILLGCFTGLWLLGEWWRKTAKADNEQETATDHSGRMQNAFQPQWPGLTASAIGLLAWLVAVEIGVQAWYDVHEGRLPAAQQWTVIWPASAKTLPIASAAREILRYDEGRSAAWSEGGNDWQAVFLRWNPGRAAVHLAQNHTPNVCLTAAGHTLKSIAAQEWLNVHGYRLPFSVNQVMDAPQPLFVFYCLWDDRATAQGFQTMSLTHGQRLAPVLAGLRNPGQRSLEILVTGPQTAEAAKSALQAELQKLVARAENQN